MKEIYFNRGVFLSWFCSVGDCKFCYMSTQKAKIKNPRMARRTKESVLAEILICKLYNWKIEFISAGYNSYKFTDLVELIRDIYLTYGEKLPLNIGTLTESQLLQLKPYISGTCGTVECPNPKLREYLCPSKPMDDIEEVFDLCNKYNLKKAMTIILGMGETIHDYPWLKTFIQKHKIDHITYYRLKPQEGTELENEKPISKDYFADWIKITKKDFPGINITVGSWITHLDEISTLINAGADGISKFPAIKYFNTKFAKTIQDQIRKAGCVPKSNLTVYEETDIDNIISRLPFELDLKNKIKIKLLNYLDQMKKQGLVIDTLTN